MVGCMRGGLNVACVAQLAGLPELNQSQGLTLQLVTPMRSVN
jgi:hypothetical protein